jgi:uncharacterized protein
VVIATSKSTRIEYEFPQQNFIYIGPRQVGKTTFLKLFIKQLIDKGINPKNLLYFSCELISNYTELVEIIRYFDTFVGGKKYIFFDEITFVKNWQNAVKYVLDSELGKNKLLLITGSSSLELRKETFPGRDIRINYFMPLEFKQFCLTFASDDLKAVINKGRTESFSIKQLNEVIKPLLFHLPEINRLFNTYLTCGGFPRSIYAYMDDQMVSEEIYDIYWNWLISDIAKIDRSQMTCSSVLLGVLKSYGSRLSLNSIAKEMKIGSHVTVREYLEILEELFVLRNIFPIDPHSSHGSMRRMRKVYFTDGFLYHTLKKKMVGLSVKESEIPMLVEGIVAEYMARNYDHLFYYYQRKELDFIVDNTGIEVKWQNKVKRADFPLISISNKILLSKTDHQLVEADNLLILPVAVFLLQ